MDKNPLIRKCLVVAIILLFFGTSIIPSTALNIEKPAFPTASGKWLYVGGSGPGNYTYIQDAIDNSSNGDTVFVYSGTYYENIDINKSINVFGQDKETTIIEGKLNDNIVNITVNSVNLGGFSIISDWEHEPLFGIYVQANDTIIKDNIIKTDEANIVLHVSSVKNI